MSIYEILMVVLAVARLVLDIIKFRKENRKSRPDLDMLENIGSFCRTGLNLTVSIHHEMSSFLHQPRVGK